MRDRSSFAALAVMASVGLLASGPALAQDPDPLAPQYKTCTAAGITVQTAGPTACGADTCISYAVTEASVTPDHVGTFVRAEAPILSVSGSNSVTSCGGADATLGLGSNLLCHERFIRWNNQQAKGKTFNFRVQGARKPILTSVVVKKGNSQGTCQMTGVGFLDVAAGDSCVSTCGNFHPKQTILKEEILRFLTGTGKSCYARFRRDLASGQVIEAGLTSTSDPSSPSHPDCDFVENLVSDLQLLLGGNIIIGGSGGAGGQGQFGDGIIATGSESCTTRVIGGRVYTWGDPCPD